MRSMVRGANSSHCQAFVQPLLGEPRVLFRIRLWDTVSLGGSCKLCGGLSTNKTGFRCFSPLNISGFLGLVSALKSNILCVVPFVLYLGVSPRSLIVRLGARLLGGLRSLPSCHPHQLRTKPAGQ